MPVYVAEISGRGVIAFDAPDNVDAEARLADRDCCGIFGCVKTKAVLFGTGSLQSTAEALPEEIEPGRRGAPSHDNDDNGDLRRRAFLVPVVDPTRFDDEDDRDDFDNGD